MMKKGTDEFKNGIDIFLTDVGMTFDIPTTSVMGYILIQETRKSSGDCVGDLQLRKCSLKPSTMLYDISMSGTNITFTSNSWRDDIFVKEKFVPFPAEQPPPHHSAPY